MSYIRCVRGIASGVEYSADVPMNLDPVDGRPVEMVLDLERLAREKPDAAWYRPQRRDLWRFGALMALDADDPVDAAHLVPLGEGATPLLDYSTHPVAAKAGLALQLKDEGKAHPGYGANPTQSFKDRGMPKAITASGIQSRVSLEIEVCPRSNAPQAKRAIAIARNPTNTIAIREAKISRIRRAGGCSRPSTSVTRMCPPARSVMPPRR